MIADYKITSFSVLFPSHNRSAVDCVTGIKTAFQQLEDESCLKKGTYSNPHSPPYSLSNLLQRPKAQEIHRCYQYSSHHLSRQYFTMQMQTQSHFQPVRLSRACLPPALPCGLPAWGTRHLAPGTCTVPLQTRVGRPRALRPRRSPAPQNKQTQLSLEIMPSDSGPDARHTVRSTRILPSGWTES